MADSRHSDADSEVVLVLSTFSDLAAAETCAGYLVEHSLAACVQIDGPIRSVYQWKGSIENDQEFRLLIKKHLKNHSMDASLLSKSSIRMNFQKLWCFTHKQVQPMLFG